MNEKVAQKIETIKNNGLSVYSVKLSGQTYIYRGTSRKEFRDLQSLMAKMADELRAKFKDDEGKLNSELALLKEKGEEKLFQKCVIDPALENELDIDVIPAGIVTKVSDLIMKASGFDESEPEVTQL